MCRLLSCLSLVACRNANCRGCLQRHRLVAEHRPKIQPRPDGPIVAEEHFRPKNAGCARVASSGIGSPHRINHLLPPGACCAAQPDGETRLALSEQQLGLARQFGGTDCLDQGHPGQAEKTGRRKHIQQLCTDCSQLLIDRQIRFLSIVAQLLNAIARPLRNGVEQSVLAGKMIVDRALRHLRGLCDTIHAGLAEPARLKLCQGGLENIFALLPRQCERIPSEPPSELAKRNLDMICAGPDTDFLSWLEYTV